MKIFKIGDRIVSKKGRRKAIIIDPKLHGSVSDNSALVIEDGSDYHQIWPESEIEYDKEWLREQKLNKLL